MPPLGSCVTVMLDRWILKNPAVSTVRVPRSNRTSATESGVATVDAFGEPGGAPAARPPPAGAPGMPAILIRGGARYTSFPAASNPGKPVAPPTSAMTSCGRGADITRVIFPSLLMTSIDSDAGSMNNAESPRYEIRPPGRAPYAFAVLLVESATTVTCDKVESNSSTRRLRMSFTSTLPPGRGTAVVTAVICSVDRATVAPNGRTGGSVCACTVVAASDAASIR